MYPFLHANQPQSSICRGLFDVEAGTRIGHYQFDLIRSSPYLYLELLHPAVFNRVV